LFIVPFLDNHVRGCDHDHNHAQDYTTTVTTTTRTVTTGVLWVLLYAVRAVIFATHASSCGHRTFTTCVWVFFFPSHCNGLIRFSDFGYPTGKLSV
jgi:hypothetical protein